MPEESRFFQNSHNIQPCTNIRKISVLVVVEVLDMSLCLVLQMFENLYFGYKFSQISV